MSEYEELRDPSTGDHPDVNSTPYVEKHPFPGSSDFTDALDKREKSFSAGTGILSKDAPRIVRDLFGGK